MDTTPYNSFKRAKLSENGEIKSLLSEIIAPNDIDIIDEQKSTIATGPRDPYATYARNITVEQVILAQKHDLDLKDQGLPKQQTKFSRSEVLINEHDGDPEKLLVSKMFLQCLRMRKKFVWMPKVFNREKHNIRVAPQYSKPVHRIEDIPKEKLNFSFKFVNGVMHVTDNNTNSNEPIYLPPNWTEFCDALIYIVGCATNGPCKSFSHTRLTLLEAQKNLHSMLNNELELSQSKAIPHRDFYNVRKVDNHVHHSACMNQKHLLRYIKKTLRQSLNDKELGPHVIERDGKKLSLVEVFESLGITPYDLSIDMLDMHAAQTFQRFDKFNLKYNPIGESRLREIFLKYDNLVKGKFLAEVTQEVFADLESNKYQFAEYRVSIYGRQRKEWDTLADWVIDNNLFSSNVRWMIQVPRLYGVYKKAKLINNLQDMLNNIFIPLFEVTIDPLSHPKLHTFLESVVGIDCVDDESVRTRFFDARDPPPEEWDNDQDPHYCAFLYYLYANLWVLNNLREQRGFRTFALRPHAGEAGDVEHIAASFLIAHGINHGLTLFKSTPMQYLYYLCQSGISMSPLSNNLLFLDYGKNPFPKYFSRGLNVTLSTDDPLMIHVTKEPLVEEYSIASQVWKLSSIDMCEIARNSVLQSGFEHIYKAHWLGNDYWIRDVNGNDIRCTNVPDIRIQFRYDLLHKEHKNLAKYAEESYDESLIDPIY